MLFLVIAPLHGAMGSDSYVQSILTHYFNVDVPENIFQEKKIPLVMDFLKKNGFQAYQKGKCTYTHSYYGNFQFDKEGPQFLWLYSHWGVHHGLFAILNSHLEVIYFKDDMGALYDLQVKDLMNDGDPWRWWDRSVRKSDGSH
jgi:hypothetical protein